METSMPDSAIGRNEFTQFVSNYEIRHQELRLEMKDLESDIKSQMRDIKSDIKDLSNKVDALSNRVDRTGTDVWKLIATACVSAILGYIAYYIQHYIHP